MKLPLRCITIKLVQLLNKHHSWLHRSYTMAVLQWHCCGQRLITSVRRPLICRDNWCSRSDHWVGTGSQSSDLDYGNSRKKPHHAHQATGNRLLQRHAQTYCPARNRYYGTAGMYLENQSLRVLVQTHLRGIPHSYWDRTHWRCSRSSGPGYDNSRRKPDRAHRVRQNRY